MFRLRRWPFWIALVVSLAADGCNSTPLLQDAGADTAALDVQTVDVSDTADVTSEAQCAVDARQTYPSGPYDPVSGLVPDLQFTDASGHAVALHDFYTPCVSPHPLLIIRTFAAWSSLSRQAASHTGRYRSHPSGGRMRLLDLLVFSQENLPASSDDLAEWQTHYDTAPDVLVADPTNQLPAAPYLAPELPTVLFVDTTTMQVVQFVRPLDLANELLSDAIDGALAQIDGTPRPHMTPLSKVDGRFTPDQWELIQAMTPVGAPPPDPTNAHADDPAAARLGESLFSDSHFSPSNVTCASCHSPTNHFMDGRATGMGVSVGDRNTPSMALSAYARWQFWDGRADTLWSQALGPIENPIEMASSRLLVAHAIATRYAPTYTAIFGPLPQLSDATRFPPSGRPGDATWTAMTAADQDAVTRVFVNVGKALEAYERTLRPAPVALDSYAAGQFDALSTAARDGLANFVNFGCIQCHFGPRLTDDSFHNVGVATGRQDLQPDRGRVDGVALLAASAFRADGAYSDAPAQNAHLRRLTPEPMMLGQFHTPPLRGVAVTAPWGHGGTFTQLTDEITHYGGFAINPALTTGPLDLNLPPFDTSPRLGYVAQLAAFLNTLNAP